MVRSSSLDFDQTICEAFRYIRRVRYSASCWIEASPAKDLDISGGMAGCWRRIEDQIGISNTGLRV